MRIEEGYDGCLESGQKRKYVHYSKEELIHLFAQSTAEGKHFVYETLNEFGFIQSNNHLKIKSNLLETAYLEFLPPPAAQQAAQLTKKLMCYDVKPSWHISYKEIVDRAFELALADEELENILQNTPLSIKWNSVAIYAEEIILTVNNSMYLIVSFYDDVYGENKVANPNFHDINKDTFAHAH